MAAISVTFDLKQMDDLVSQLTNAARKTLVAEAAGVLKTRLEIADAAIIANLSGAVLKRRTGNLARSVRHTQEVSGPTVIGQVGILADGPVQKYAAIQLFGGTIRPKNAKFLAIPIGQALTASGVPRYGSPLRQSLPGAFPAGTFVAKGILFGKLGNTPGGTLTTKGGRNIVPLFVLKSSVTIPAHDYMSGPRQELLAGVSLDLVGILQNLLNQ